MEYTDLIISSRSKSGFTFHMSNKDEILDFKSWWPVYYKRNVLSMESQGRRVPRELKQNFSISEFIEFSHSKHSPGAVKAQNFIDGLQEHTFRLAESDLIPDFPTKLAFLSEIPMISDKKMANFKKSEPYLPQSADIQIFYSNLYSKPTYADKEN